MRQISNYDAIIFDLGAVLVGLNEGESYERLSSLYGLSQVQQAQLKSVYLEYEIGKLTSNEFYESFSGFALRNKRELPSRQAFDEAWNAMIKKVPPENIALLKGLKNDFGTDLYLLSNTNAIHLDYFWSYAFYEEGHRSEFEGLFERLYYSHLMGLRKPDPRIFSVVIENHKMCPEKTLFIDDKKENLDGASRVGLDTHLVTSLLHECKGFTQKLG